MDQSQVVPDEERVDIVYVPLNRIRRAAKNSNTMDPDDYERLKRSITTLGFVAPCVVVAAEDDDDADYEMVAGHHRMDALADLGRKFCPSIVASNWDDAHKIVAGMALNKIHGQPNMTVVAEQLHELMQDGWDLEDMSLSGFTESEISDLMRAMEDDVDAIDASEMVATSIEENVPTPADRPFVLEMVFRTKEQRNKVRKALKSAGNGDISVGVLALTGVEEEAT